MPLSLPNLGNAAKVVCCNARWGTNVQAASTPKQLQRYVQPVLQKSATLLPCCKRLCTVKSLSVRANHANQVDTTPKKRSLVTVVAKSAPPPFPVPEALPVKAVPKVRTPKRPTKPIVKPANRATVAVVLSGKIVVGPPVPKVITLRLTALII